MNKNTQKGKFHTPKPKLNIVLKVQGKDRMQTLVLNSQLSRGLQSKVLSDSH